MTAGKTVDGVDGFANAFGTDYCYRLGAAAHVHCGEQSGQTEKVVAVQVRDTNHRHRLYALVIGAHLVLRAFAAVEQYAEPTDVHHLRAAMTCQRWNGSPRTEYGDVEIGLVHRDRLVGNIDKVAGVGIEKGLDFTIRQFHGGTELCYGQLFLYVEEFAIDFHVGLLR